MTRFHPRGLAPFQVEGWAADALSVRICRELQRSTPDAWPSFAALSAALCTTPSTLRRRLEKTGACYRKIKDAVRARYAIDQLRANAASNAEIAAALGYGDPSTFYRAFRRWTGATPNAYRAAAGSDAVLAAE